MTARPTKLFARIRHWRGHGIHSPYVYRLVREVFMDHTIAHDPHGPYDELRRMGIRKKTARQIHNLHCFSGCCEYAIGEATKADFRIVPAGSPHDSVAANLDSRDGIIIVLRPYGRRATLDECKREAVRQRGLTIDKGRFFVFFPTETEPKQHFKI